MAKKTDTSRVALVDELVALTVKLTPYETDIKRREALKKLVRTWPEADECAADFSVPYLGTKGNLVVLGPCENERKFKAGALALIYGMLGKAKFLAACSFTLKAATEAVGEARLGALVTEARTGSRAITVTQAA